MARPIAIAVANRIALMPTTPASRTKILNGAGGGSRDGTRTAMTPWRWSDAIARSILSPVKRFLTSASPPFRPIACITRQPASEPPIAARMYHATNSLCRAVIMRSEEHTSELQSRENLVCRLLLEKKKIAGSQDHRRKKCEKQPHFLDY